MKDAKAFAAELERRLVVRSQEYMHLAGNAFDPNSRADAKRRDDVITKANIYTEIADLIRLAAKETL